MFARRPDYLLKVRGMSMRDAGIMDGDLLAVQKAQRRQERPDRRRAARRRRHRQALPPHAHQHRADPREPRLQDHRRAVRRRRLRARRRRRRADPQQHADVRRHGQQSGPIKSPKARQRRTSARRSSSCPTSARRIAADLRSIGIAAPARAGRPRRVRAVPAAVRARPASGRTRACSTPSWPPPTSCAARRPRRGGSTRAQRKAVYGQV